MNITEQHIEINQSAQEIGLTTKRKFLPEEIDWILNKVIGRFIDSNIKYVPSQGEMGLQHALFDDDNIHTLLEFEDVVTHKYSLTESDTYLQYPQNLRNFISVSLNTHKLNCVGGVYGPTFIPEQNYICIVEFTPSFKTSAPFFTAPSVSINGQLLSLRLPSNLPAREMDFVLSDSLQNQLVSTNYGNYKIYWERYKTIYSPNSLILVTDAAINELQVVYDGIQKQMFKSVFENFKPISVSVKGLWSAGRNIKKAWIPKLQESQFAKSEFDSPIISQTSSGLRILTDDKFIVTKGRIHYIRKPQKVSLSLRRDCDLPVETHQKICDLAVEYIKNAISDPNYEWKLQDNKLRT